MATETVDLKAFCGDFISCDPFVIDGKKYATDRMILVRTDTADPNTQHHSSLNASPEFFEGFPDEALMLPWPESNPAIKEMECEECPDDDCEDCGGFGTIECPHCGNDDDCDKCGGSGVILGDCSVCNNTRRVTCPAAQPIGHISIGYKYDQLIRSLPNVRYAIFPCLARDYDVVGFRFDGGEGIVAPMSKY